MDALSNDLRTYFDEALVGLVGAVLVRTALALLALIATLLLAKIGLAAARRTLYRTTPHANARLLVDRIVQFSFLALAAVWVLSIYGVEITALAAVLGAAALAVSLSLQDVLKNLVAGLYILLERPFTIGEQIDFKTFSGTVETIRLRTTDLRTASGQRVIIPNAMLFADALVNRSTYGRQQSRLRVVMPVAEASRSRPNEILEAVRATLGPALLESTVHVESITPEKLTMRLDLWTVDGRASVQEAAWAVKERMPSAEVNVVE